MSLQSRRARPKPLRRKSGIRSEKQIIWAFVEGEATEADYIAGLRSHPAVRERVSLDIRVRRSGGQPLPLVEAAVKAKADARTEVDSYWCIFDVESPQQHPNLQDAIDKAQAARVSVAYSNPCFELWLLLHHESVNAALDTKVAVRRRLLLDGVQNKHLDASWYFERFGLAEERAQSLRRRHDANGNKFPLDNPTSNLDIFVRSVVSRE